MSTTSSQRPNFQPAASIVPTWREAERAVHADRRRRSRESPITASIWRAPAASQRAQQFGEQQPADALAGRVGGEVDRVLEAEAIGRPRPELVGVGVAAARAPPRSSDELGQALGEHVGAARGHLGVVGRLDLERAGAVAHVLAVDGGDRRQVGVGARADQDAGAMVMGFEASRPEFIMRGSPGSRDAGQPPLALEEYIMVVIRLSRGGAKKRPFFNIVVADSRLRRDGRFIERVGFYNPVASGGEQPLRVAFDRIEHWTGARRADVADGRAPGRAGEERRLVCPTGVAAPWPGEALAPWPDDALEVGRIGDAWGLKGWFQVQPYADPPRRCCRRRAGSSSRAEGSAPAPARVATLPRRSRSRSVRASGDGLIASSPGVAGPDRGGGAARRAYLRRPIAASRSPPKTSTTGPT